MTLGAYSTDNKVRLNWPKIELVIPYSSCIVAQCTTSEPAVTKPDNPSRASTPAFAARSESGSQPGSGDAARVRRPTREPTPMDAPTAWTMSTLHEGTRRARRLQFGDHRCRVVDDGQCDGGDQQRSAQSRRDYPPDDEPRRRRGGGLRSGARGPPAPSAAIPAAAASHPVRGRRSKSAPDARRATCWRSHPARRSYRCWRSPAAAASPPK